MDSAPPRSLIEQLRRGTNKLRRALGHTLAFAIVWSAGWLHSEAAEPEPECIAAVNFDHHAEQRTYRVNLGSFGAANIGKSAAGYAVMLAADTWNEQARAAYFTYVGGSGDTDLPQLQSDCIALGIDDSLVVMVSSLLQTNVRARATPRCIDSQGRPQQFLIEIAARANGAPLPWATTDVQSDELDLVWTLAHEFGHTFGHGHHVAGPGNDAPAVMSPTASAPGSIERTAGRDLWYLDEFCSENPAGASPTYVPRRTVAGVVREVNGGTVGPSQLAVASGTSGSVGYNLSASIATPAVAWHDADDVRWGESVPTMPSATLGTVPVETGSVPVYATWREDETMDYVVYSAPFDEPVMLTWEGSQRVNYVRSDDDFAPAPTSGHLKECTAMTSWMTCTNREHIATAHRVAVAWDTYWEASVAAWVRQDRSSAHANRDVRVAFGRVDVGTLPTSDSAGVSTSVAPGLACQAWKAAGYDCMLAYVDESDPLGFVRVRRFFAKKHADRYAIVLDDKVTLVDLTATSASALTAWYQDGSFWLAMRLAANEQPLAMYRSTDTVTWTREGTTWGPTVIGPSSAAYWDGVNNYVMTWE